jgi:hypothetical protein
LRGNSSFQLILSSDELRGVLPLGIAPANGDVAMIYSTMGKATM